MKQFRISYKKEGINRITFDNAEDETQAKAKTEKRFLGAEISSIEDCCQLKTDIEINGVYLEAVVDFEIEGDVDGVVAIIKQITLATGKVIPDNPEYDLSFLCKEHYSNLQDECYMKTGRFI